MVRSRKVFAGTGIVVVVIIFALASHEVLTFANRQFADADGPSRFQLLPSKAIWWFFPGFGALSLSPQIVLSCGPPRRQEIIKRYVKWGNQRQGFDGMKGLMNWLAAAIALPIAIATVLAIPIHTSLRDSDMVVGQYATLSSRRYLYSQAQRLKSVDGFRDRDGKFTARAGNRDFAGGYHWYSADNRDFTRAVDAGFTNFLQQKTGLPLTRRKLRTTYLELQDRCDSYRANTATLKCG